LWSTHGADDERQRNEGADANHVDDVEAKRGGGGEATLEFLRFICLRWPDIHSSGLAASVDHALHLNFVRLRDYLLLPLEAIDGEIPFFSCARSFS